MFASLPFKLQAREQAFPKCDKVVDNYIRDYKFQGVVFLGQKGQSLFSRTVGFADFERQTRMTSDTVFGIASISKMLTSVTVLRLIEQKQLGLDEPISAYLPDFRKDQGKVLTLRRLLANDSGVLNQFSAAWKADPTVMEKPMATMQAVHRYCEADLAFAPGARFDYSLSNWILVLAIVEAVT
ncbi:MAG: serine hydrolase, partial [Terracidiphilus sp.]|nr:serine hydrolase [Terracidiphilus sp.]